MLDNQKFEEQLVATSSNSRCKAQFRIITKISNIRGYKNNYNKLIYIIITYKHIIMSFRETHIH